MNSSPTKEIVIELTEKTRADVKVCIMYKKERRKDEKCVQNYGALGEFQGIGRGQNHFF